MIEPLRSHHRKPAVQGAIKILRTLLELAGQDRRGDGWHLEARKIRHYDRAPFMAWDEAGNRTKDANPRAWTELVLGWANDDGTFEGPPPSSQAEPAGPAATWIQTLVPWAEALAAQAGPDQRPALEEARARITALAQEAQAPKILKGEAARTWLERHFGRKTELPAADVLKAAEAEGIRTTTLIKARKAAGYGIAQRWHPDPAHPRKGRNVHTWTRPQPDKDPA